MTDNASLLHIRKELSFSAMMGSGLISGLSVTTVGIAAIQAHLMVAYHGAYIGISAAATGVSVSALTASCIIYMKVLKKIAEERNKPEGIVDTDPLSATRKSSLSSTGHERTRSNPVSTHMWTHSFCKLQAATRNNESRDDTLAWLDLAKARTDLKHRPNGTQADNYSEPTSSDQVEPPLYHSSTGRRPNDNSTPIRSASITSIHEKGPLSQPLSKEWMEYIATLPPIDTTLSGKIDCTQDVMPQIKAFAKKQAEPLTPILHALLAKASIHDEGLTAAINAVDVADEIIPERVLEWGEKALDAVAPVSISEFKNVIQDSVQCANVPELTAACKKRLEFLPQQSLIGKLELFELLRKERKDKSAESFWKRFPLKKAIMKARQPLSKQVLVKKLEQLLQNIPSLKSQIEHALAFLSDNESISYNELFQNVEHHLKTNPTYANFWYSLNYLISRQSTQDGWTRVRAMRTPSNAPGIGGKSPSDALKCISYDHWLKKYTTQAALYAVCKFFKIQGGVAVKITSELRNVCQQNISRSPVVCGIVFHVLENPEHKKRIDHVLKSVIDDHMTNKQDLLYKATQKALNTEDVVSAIHTVLEALQDTLRK